MNTRFLEAFVWVARLQSFKSAAERLHTTQPGISNRIATLEEQLGVRLLERGAGSAAKSICLTPHGTAMLPLAEQVLRIEAQMRQTVGQTEFSGVLRLGVIETVAHTWLPELLTSFGQICPRVQVELRSDLTPRLRDELIKASLDVVLLTEPVHATFVDNRPLADLEMTWVAAPSLGLSGRVLALADLSPYPVISFLRDSVVYQDFARAVAQHGGEISQFRVSFFSSLTAMIALSLSGYGVALLPRPCVARELSAGTLQALSVSPTPARLPLVAASRSEPGSPVAARFVDCAAEAAATFSAAIQVTDKQV